jgi:hypothetical protein
MKSWKFLLAAALASCCVWAGAQPAPGGSCKAKHDEISRNLDQARAKGQKQRVAGLAHALSEVDANCSDARLQAQSRRRIQRQEEAVAARERDLEKAQREGSAKKVAQRQSKLLEEQAKLQRLKDAGPH